MIWNYLRYNVIWNDPNESLIYFNFPSDPAIGGKTTGSVFANGLFLCYDVAWNGKWNDTATEVHI